MQQKISDSELEVMRILWREARPLSFTEIRKELETTTDWKKSTMQTLLTRLRDKGIVRTHEHYVTLYTANITEEEHVQEEGQNFLNKLFGGSAKNLLAALHRGGKLNQNDVDDLRDFFNMEDNDQ